MTFYIVAALVFWALALLALCRPSAAKSANIAALAIFVLIAGLRYQTGYDWWVYGNYLDAIANIKACYSGPLMEPFFWLLGVFITALGGNVQTLFILTLCFNGLVFYHFCRKLEAPFALAAAVFFCWIYLPLQMGVVRQSIAVSFFLLAFLALRQNHRLRTGGWALAAAGFQSSAVLYIPLFWSRLWDWIWKHLNIILAVCLVCAALFPSPSLSILTWVAHAHIPFFSPKIETYLNPALFNPMSKGYLAYLIFNVAFLLVVRNRLTLEKEDRSLLYPLILMILLEANFYDFPYLWTRLQVLAIPCQAVFVARFFAMRVPVTTIIGKALFGAAVLLSLGALDIRLHRPLMEPYLPYQNIVMAHFNFYPENDGLIRTENMYRVVEERKGELKGTTKDHGLEGQAEFYSPEIPCATLAPEAVWNKLTKRIFLKKVPASGE